MRAAIASLALLLPSCAAVTEKGAIVVGGKGVATGKGWSLVYSQEKSFAAAVNTIGTVAAGAFAAGSLKAAEVTSRAVNSNATRQAIAIDSNATKAAINANNNATAVKLAELPPP